MFRISILIPLLRPSGASIASLWWQHCAAWASLCKFFSVIQLSCLILLMGLYDSKLTGRGLQAMNLSFITHCLQDAINFGSHLIHSRTKSKAFHRLQLPDSSFDIFQAIYPSLGSFHKNVSSIYAQATLNYGKCCVGWKQVSCDCDDWLMEFISWMDFAGAVSWLPSLSWIVSSKVR